MHDFTRLKVWNLAMDLTVKIYKLTRSFPKHELYGLTSQVRRCAVSVPSNIAEGAYRNTSKEFNYFLGISSGSVGEAYTQVELAKRLEYITEDEAAPVLDELIHTKRMIGGLKNSLK